VNYYNFKEEHPEIHQQIEMEQVRYIGDDDVITVPPYKTQCGRRVLIYRMGNWNPRKYPVEEIFKATVTVLELGILEPIAQILGGVVIFDLKDITMAHAWCVTPQVRRHFISFLFFPSLSFVVSSDLQKQTRRKDASCVRTRDIVDVLPGGEYDAVLDGDRVPYQDTRDTYSPSVMDFRCDFRGLQTASRQQHA
jgi:hypothetical protein